ncbi:BamA/TamA family outer membrane protein [Ulvibacter sp. MAR_2010_11]|uniref:translocation and assembly module lipoprotein TamL n=1 Tax=Ulvibacter sp. MAR_2010_11 TaxID=1250229 RepID=UPI000C2C8654|nr:BamA/TamA family outer membrane protein [Ulvibacter sp. MAR_2010_11]
MTQSLTKISLILGLTIFLLSCDAVKRVADDKFLLTDNTIIVDSVKSKDTKVYSQLAQKPNTKVLGIPIGIHIYNLADPQPDSTFQKWLHKNPKREERLVRFLSQKQVDELGYSYVGLNKWLKKSGDEPVVISESRINKSLDRLKRYYSSFGYFNTKADYTINKNEKRPKRASITYNVQRYQPYFVDSISENISSPVVDSLFKATRTSTFIKSGKQYAANDFVNERDRLTIQFRNSGLYYFDQDYVGFEADTVNTGHKANITYIIPDRKISEEDSSHTEPFKIHTINEVRVVTDYSFTRRNEQFKDSASHNGYKLYSYDALKFNPKAITDAISISPNKIFKDIDRTLTYTQISDLRIFKYPNISYQEDPADTTGTGLIATILLTPQKKYTLGVDFDVIPFPSPIQQFGMGFSSTLLIRNVFRGAETLELSGRGSVGSSKDAGDGSSSFFNTSELGGDIKLSFPRILFPINTDKFIPKYMSPFTSFSIGASAQNNIGLDRQTVNAIFNYRWKPSKIRRNQLDLMNIQYVRNLDVDNYFNVYPSSYDRLNEIAQDVGYTFSDPANPVLEIPDEANQFIDDFLDPTNQNSDFYDEVLSISERRFRLTENNLIFASNFIWTRDTREGLQDNTFSRFRWKAEIAGNVLSGIAGIAGLPKDANGNYKTFGVVFSQYAKLESEYIKHWELNDKNVLAFRVFGGLAVPYGNSNSVPFTRSYFAGGTNDNRGWRAYDLGPGSSGGIFDFNEANFKIALNGEYRYTILGALKGAFFVDAGNIWNVFDNIEDPASRFDGIQDLKEIAVASGFGLRYDFGFFVFRFDIGFKTHDPGRPVGERWFKDYNFPNAVYNIGINYPF